MRELLAYPGHDNSVLKSPFLSQRRRRYLDRLLLSSRTYSTEEEYNRTQKEEIVCASRFGHRERRRRRRRRRGKSLGFFWRKRKASGIKLVIMRPPRSQACQRGNLSGIVVGASPTCLFVQMLLFIPTLLTLANAAMNWTTVWTTASTKP